MDAETQSITKRGRPVGAKDSSPRRRQNFGKGELAQRLERLQSAGVLRDTASKVLYALGDESYWLRLIGELEAQGDWSTIVKLMPFLLQMRDGRPKQQINITSASIHISPEQIAHARSVVRQLAIGHGEDRAKTIEYDTIRIDTPPNAFDDQGAKKEGRG